MKNIKNPDSSFMDATAFVEKSLQNYSQKRSIFDPHVSLTGHLTAFLISLEIELKIIYPEAHKLAVRQMHKFLELQQRD